MATYIWFNIDPGNGLLPDCTLPETILNYHQMCSVAFECQQVPIDLIRKMCSKITRLKLLLYPPEADVFNHTEGSTSARRKYAYRLCKVVSGIGMKCNIKLQQVTGVKWLVYMHGKACKHHSIFLIWSYQFSIKDFKEPLIANAKYRQISDISRTKSQTLNVSCFVLHLSLLNPLKPGMTPRMKM